MVKLPDPVAGLVFRYDYLWLREHRLRRETSKDRPVCLIMPLGLDPETGRPRFMAAPITHSEPDVGEPSLELPVEEKRRLRLDGERSWIVLSELNLDRWPDGFVPVQGNSTGIYGVLSSPLLRRVGRILREETEAGRLQIIRRF